MIVMIKVIPNAQKNEIVEFVNLVLKVRVKAPPDKGKANEGLVWLLSEKLSVPKSQIQILSGHASRLKKVEIQADIELSNSPYDTGR